tara:strand:- start:5624 stop:6871 length:1248 start_codon:yes stop_codon:yes gene_type:complete
VNPSQYNSKRKILNDPIYGFITINNELIFDLIEHPYFQRLRRISQLGLTNLVYSGANHTRFQHALGAMYLMGKAIDTLRQKGHEISEDEALGVTIAILLHDIGHGPFSHTLENTIVPEVSHEELSLLFMDRLNKNFGGKLDIAIQIFKNEHPKKYLNQLVSSQLDIDRLDYLRRDSFFTGVTEGIVGSDRIIKMMNVYKDNLVIEAKGIYSIEKFLVARRLMYWQVYLHKTVLSAENMLMRILGRAKELALQGTVLPCSNSLRIFLYEKINKGDFKTRNDLLDSFSQLDDYDVLGAIKQWMNSGDFVLSKLSTQLVNRNLLKIKLQKNPFTELEINKLVSEVAAKNKISLDEAKYFVFSKSIDNRAYINDKFGINLLYKDGSVKDIASAADLLNISALAEPVIKYFFCYPKGRGI